MSNTNDLELIQPESITRDDWLPAREVAELTPGVLQQRLRSLQPMIRENARKAETLRRPVTDVISAIRKTGMFYLMVPRAYGGMGASPNDLLDVTTPIAEACMSTAWVCNFVINHSWLAAHLSEKVHQETWGSAYPYTFVTTVSNPPGKAQRVDGGYRVSGRWKWASGILHADWIIGFVFLETDGEPVFGLALFPIADAKIVDTWHTDGLCGTGSHDIIAEDLFVPSYRTAPLGPILDGSDGAAEKFGSSVYGMPMVPFLGFAAACPAIGGAKAAIAAIADRLRLHTRVGEMVAQVEKPLSQTRLARADLMVQQAEAVLRKVGHELVGYQNLPVAERSMARLRWRALNASAVHMCHEAVIMASASAGSSLHFLENPLQRIMRDISVQSTHYAFDQDVAQEQYGRALVGLPPSVAFY